MKTTIIAILTLRVLHALSAPLPPSTSRRHPRDLLGLTGDPVGTEPDSAAGARLQPTDGARSLQAAHSQLDGLFPTEQGPNEIPTTLRPQDVPGGLPLDLLTATAHMKSKSTATGTAAASGPTTYSIIGSPAPLTYTATPHVPIISQTTNASATSSTAAATSSSSSSSPLAGVSTEWKVIGVTVIAFSSVGVIILAAVFFDQWARFLGDVLCGCRGPRARGEELLPTVDMPDWEKREWAVRVADEEDPLGRYPSFTSLPSVAKLARGRSLERKTAEAGLPQLVNDPFGGDGSVKWWEESPAKTHTVELPRKQEDAADRQKLGFS